jgi:hypothetical protein
MARTWASISTTSRRQRDAGQPASSLISVVGLDVERSGERLAQIVDAVMKLIIALAQFLVVGFDLGDRLGGIVAHGFLPLHSVCRTRWGGRVCVWRVVVGPP